MDEIMIHSGSALSSLESFATLWSAFVQTFSECASMSLTMTGDDAARFEDSMRRLRLAHQFLKESLVTIQRQTFLTNEACRTSKMSAFEFATGRTTTRDCGAPAASPLKQDGTSTKKTAAKNVETKEKVGTRAGGDLSASSVIDLVDKKVANAEENMEVADEVLHTVSWETSTADWTRFSLILSRGSK